MKNNLIIIGSLVILLTISLIGCFEFDNFERTDKVQLIDYTVQSYKFGKDVYSPNIILGDGFDYEEDMFGFNISGTIKNIDDEPMEKIKIVGKFYEDNGDFLGKGSTDPIIAKVPSWDTRDFKLFFHEEKHLLYVVNVKFEFYAAYRQN